MTKTRMIRSAVLSLGLIFFTVTQAFAQGYAIRGMVVDSKDQQPLIGVTAILEGQNKTVSTNDKGAFSFAEVPNGSYTITLSYLSYKKQQLSVTVKDKDAYAGNVKMLEEKQSLKEVTIKGVQKRVELLGEDTIQYNAETFKVNPDATAEDLVKKMPGVTYDASGNMQVNGESVKKVLVDGKEFFGDDPNTAMKNIPADIISKVQVFDNMSEQARFTGFNDGTTDAAVNLITKEGMNKGQFGRVYGGYGTDERYQAGLSLNYFNDDQRISLLGMSNNINQQNFSVSDIMGLMSSSGGGRRRGPRSSNQGGLDIRSLMHGQSNSGNTNTHAGGINYVDELGKKVKLTGSYFFNQTNNVNEALLTRNYFTDIPQVYQENSTTESTNTNHRMNMRVEYKIDDRNTLTYTPALTIQQNDYNTTLLGATSINDAPSVSNTENRQYSNDEGYSFTNSLLFRHKFKKRGRTLSIGANANFHGREGTGEYFSLTNDSRQAALLDQSYTTDNNGQIFSANIAYTEPLGKRSQLMIEYKPSLTENNADKTTKDMDSLTGGYTDLNELFSNKYTNTYTAQRGGVTYKWNNRKTNFSIGADIQQATLEGQQTYPSIADVERSFTNILPNASFTYRKGRGKSLRIRYRSSTNAPDITDLQNVVDISNPLLLSTGNPSLKQNFQNSFMVHYRTVDLETSRMFFTMFRGTYTQDHISTQTLIPTTDTVVNGVQVNRGSQISMPVNVNGYYNLRTFAMYGLPVSLLKSNVNFSGGVTYTRNPSLLNNETNISNNTAFNFRTFIGSNISEKVDFNLSYNGTYNIVQNSLQAQSDNNYFTHTATAGANFILGKRLVLNTDYNYTVYNGLSDSYNQGFHLWNAYIGYKLLKNRQLEAKVSVFDILNQNTDISRTVTQAYTEDNQSNVLQRYFMFSLTYTIKNFKSGDAPKGPDIPGGMPPAHLIRGKQRVF